MINILMILGALFVIGLLYIIYDLKQEVKSKQEEIDSLDDELAFLDSELDKLELETDDLPFTALNATVVVSEDGKRKTYKDALVIGPEYSPLFFITAKGDAIVTTQPYTMTLDLTEPEELEPEYVGYENDGEGKEAE